MTILFVMFIFLMFGIPLAQDKIVLLLFIPLFVVYFFIIYIFNQKSSDEIDLEIQELDKIKAKSKIR